MTATHEAPTRSATNPAVALAPARALLADIRDTAEALYTAVTHLDFHIDGDWAPTFDGVNVVEADGMVRELDAKEVDGMTPQEEWDARAWIADTFTELIASHPGYAAIAELGGSRFRLTLAEPGEGA